MKKVILIYSVLANIVFASDAITLDSMFKNQQGLRSITTLQSISSGNANSYAIYPDLVSQNDGRVYNDVKALSLTQTFMYDFTKDLDGIFSATASCKTKRIL